MKLAIVSTNKDKYSETFIHNHIKLLPAEIHFLFDGYLPSQYSIDKGLTLHSIFDFNKSKLFGLLKNKTKDTSELLNEAIENYLLKNKIEYILCEYGPSGVEIMKIANKLKIPLIVHFHGYDAYREDILSSYGKRYKELFSFASEIIAVSEHMKLQLSKLGCPENKLHKLCYGIDTTIFRLNETKTPSPTFIACGRFVEKKGPTLTIRAFEKVVAKEPNAKLVMIGDGELLQTCKDLAIALGINENVEFKGALSQEQIASEFRNALAFVQHSITTKTNDSEGTPLVILEAMSSGLAVISTLHGGIPDVVSNETGLLVKEGDVDTMAEKMLFLISNPDEAIAMGTKAAKVVAEKYSLELYIENLWHIIEYTKF